MHLKNGVIACILAGSMVSGSALACGESLFRVGKGVTYRQYTAPLPGNILAVANTEAELHMLEHLASAGHRIQVVSSPDELGAALAKDTFDVILAYYSQRDTVLEQSALSNASFIPVAIHDTEEEREAGLHFKHALSSDDSVKTFLKTIHRSLKSAG